MKLLFSLQAKPAGFCRHTVLVYIQIVVSCLLYAEPAQAQRGYFDAPYKRYEADSAVLSNGAVATARSYAQPLVQSEASGQRCVLLNSTNASVEFTLTDPADGLVIRYSVPDSQSAVVGVYSGTTYLTSLTLSTHWSWEYLWSNGNPNNSGVTNRIPRMRFDEVRFKLPNSIAAGNTLKLVRESGNIHLDFVETEAIPAAVPPPVNAVVYAGNGSNLQAFIDANGGQTIFLPAGEYSIGTELYFGVAGTRLQGAGMWYTRLNFTATATNQGGLRANAANISFADLYLTTSNNSRSNAYKGINGVFTAGSVIENIWAEHFECGAWIGQYNIGGPAIADGFLMRNCRFRNNYADGINLCKGTSNAVVEHCHFRNNGDDDQAVWSADGLECINNTFRYNTSENCWRASGVAIYGGKNNKAHHLLIRDNLEVGIRLNNTFPGVGFNSTGMHEFHDITLISCGTFNDLYNNPVGAIDIFSAGVAGTQVRNVKLTDIDILDAKNDAIMLAKYGGDGLYNLSFENIQIEGTGKEYPFNNVLNRNWGRGYFVLFSGNPNGQATYCQMDYLNRGGNAVRDVETAGQGSFSWTRSSGCVELDNLQLLLPANQAVNIDYTAVVFDWSDAPGATSYELETDTTPAFSTGTQTFTSTLSTFPIDTLLRDKTYFWRVRAMNGSTAGSWTSPWRFTTRENPVAVNTVAPEAGLTVYPNPATEFTYLETSASYRNQPFVIRDYTGRKIQEGVVLERTMIPLSGLPTGIYFLQIGNASGQIVRIMKQ